MEVGKLFEMFEMFEWSCGPDESFSKVLVRRNYCF